MRFSAGFAVLVALMLVVAACGDDDTTTTAATTTTTAATTTEAPTTTTAAATTAAPTTTAATTTEATTTAAPAAGFTAEDLQMAVMLADDPWIVTPAGASPVEIFLDDIWPEDRFPDERAAYEEAGFQAATLSFFFENDVGELPFVLSLAHLFATDQGAQAAFDILNTSHSDLRLVEEVMGLEPGDLTAVTVVDAAPDLGDRTVALRLTGDEAQVVAIIWVTGNLVHVLRAVMPPGDEREASVFDVAEAIAARMG